MICTLNHVGIHHSSTYIGKDSKFSHNCVSTDHHYIRWFFTLFAEKIDLCKANISKAKTKRVVTLCVIEGCDYMAQKVVVEVYSSPHSLIIFLMFYIYVSFNNVLHKLKKKINDQILNTYRYFLLVYSPIKCKCKILLFCKFCTR